MSADPIVYCLEQLTDYAQFERLATDLMAGTDFPNIEPLGGTGDGGRDALHVDRTAGTVTVFAYSVRVDWETKVRRDCTRIAEVISRADEVVFVSTQSISAGKRDRMRADIAATHGWGIEFFDIERIRSLLAGPLRSLLEKHRSIFVPPWFERRGGELVTHEQRDLVVIDHLRHDHSFAAWLYGRLSAAGFSVWCAGLAPLAGENQHETIGAIIQQRCAWYLPVFSGKSSQDSDLRARAAITHASGHKTMPCWIDDLAESSFDSQLRQLRPARFDRGWAHGLATLSRQLDDNATPKRLDGEAGRALALRAYQVEPLVTQEPESIYANVFPVKVPNTVLVHELDPQSPKLDPELNRRWAYVQRGPVVLSFSTPPYDVPVRRKFRPYDWSSHSHHFRIDSTQLVKMLVKRSLFVACYRAGFHWCKERHTFFLKEDRRQMHAYQDLDRRNTRVSLTGERSVRSGDDVSTFRYQLGPVFRVQIDEAGTVSVTVAFYVRIADAKGTPLDEKMIPSRRKRVTKGWWNRHWLQRTLGVMQLLAETADIDGQIVIGQGTEVVEVGVTPISWTCPVSIDVEALDRVGDFGKELATIRDESDVEHWEMEEPNA